MKQSKYIDYRLMNRLENVTATKCTTANFTVLTHLYISYINPRLIQYHKNVEDVCTIKYNLKFTQTPIKLTENV